MPLVRGTQLVVASFTSDIGVAAPFQHVFSKSVDGFLPDLQVFIIRTCLMIGLNNIVCLNTILFFQLHRYQFYNRQNDRSRQQA